MTVKVAISSKTIAQPVFLVSNTNSNTTGKSIPAQPVYIVDQTGTPIVVSSGPSSVAIKLKNAASRAFVSNPVDLAELGSTNTTPTGTQVQLTYPTSAPTSQKYYQAANGTSNIGDGINDGGWCNFYAIPNVCGGANTHVQFRSAQGPASSVGNLITGAGKSTNYRGTLACVEFETDDLIPCIKILSGGGLLKFRIVVNGQFITKSYTSFPSSGYIQMQFVDRQVRRIRLEMQEDVAFDGIYVGVNSLVWARPKQQIVRAAMLGDSYFQTTPPGGSMWDAPPVLAGRLLGWEDIRSAGIAGTGFINPGDTWTFGSHISDITSILPDVVVLGGPFNDNAQTPSAITSACLIVMQNIRAALPTIPIIVLGSWAGNTGPSAGVIASEIAIQNAFTQFNDTNSRFIPISNIVSTTGGSKFMIYGTGNDTTAAGNGNADLYIRGSETPPTHTNLIGSAYLARRLASAIRDAIASL